MSDFSELKVLAAAATPGEWLAGNAYNKCFIPTYQVLTATEDGPYVILEGNKNFLEDAEANAAYVAAASPQVVLSLISQLERARQDASNECRDWGVEYERRKAAEAERDHLANEVQRITEARRIEFNNAEQVKAELESHKRMLLAACVGLGAVGEAVGADPEDDASVIEAFAVELRKDGERYRFIRDEADTTPGAMPMAYMVDENGFPVPPMDALVGEELDTAIDAAMPARCPHGEKGSCCECQAEAADELRAMYVEYEGSVL